MKSRLFTVYQALVLRHPLLSILATLLLVGWLSSHVVNFKLDASADSLVLEGDPDLEYYRELGRNYQSEDFLLVTYQPEGELLSEPVLRNLDELSQLLSALKGVSSVVTILDVPLLNSPKVSLEDIADGEAVNTLRTPGIDKALVSDELKNSPIYNSLLTSSDASTTALQVNLRRDEQWVELLTQREDFRVLAKQGKLSSEQARALQHVEQDIRNYAVLINQQQSVLVDKVRAVLDIYRADARIFLGGVPMIAVDMIAFVKQDLVVFGTAMVLLIVATMFVIFRRATWVLLPLITCLSSAAFMLGLITLMDWRMTVISSNFVALLLIIALSITIHLVVQYREQLSIHPQWTQQKLVYEMVKHMAKPCLYAAMTTIVAFASLVVSGIRPVIDFGWMMTLGVLVSLVLSFIFIPAGLLLLKKPQMAVTSASTASVATTLRFAGFTERYGWLILLVSAALAVLSAYGIGQLKVENRFIDYFNESTEIYQGMEIIDAQLGGTIPLEVIIDADPDDFLFEEDDTELTAEPVATSSDEFDDDFSDDFEDDFSDDFAGNGESSDPSYWFNRAGLKRIETVHNYLDSLEETGKVMSLGTINQVLRQFSPGINDIELALIQKKLPASVADTLINPYLKEDINQARITVRVKETSRTLERNQLLKDVRHHLVNELGFKDEQLHLSGMLVLYNNMLQSLYRSQIQTIGAVFIAIGIMFIVLFRSLSLALLALTPTMLAAATVLGTMGLIGIPLDIMTVTIAAIAVGIGVDDTIHYVHRFREEFALDHNYLAAMYRCHGSIGKAMFYTSIVIIIGFSVLSLSNFNPSIYFGLLTGAAMFAALMGALLLLPQLLITFKPFGPEWKSAGHQ